MVKKVIEDAVAETYSIVCVIAGDDVVTEPTACATADAQVVLDGAIHISVVPQHAEAVSDADCDDGNT